jgi:NAD(P)-dependent dehydrogenase (short-subunit alcohol dehydrogenase family)
VPTAVVTGASRGIGRGVATALSAAGWRVFATGRTVAEADLPPAVTRLVCDHRDDAQTAAAFERVAAETGGRLDLLVNAAWGGYERMVEDDGRFTWGAPFWEQPAHRWAGMIDGGLRCAFVASQHAARLMIPRGAGFIVALSFWAAQRRLGNAIYGVALAAMDRMVADIAAELAPHGVSAVSLYPGLVRTERVLEAAAQGVFTLENSERPEFIGRVIAALAAAPDLPGRSGRALVAAALAQDLGVEDVDGRRPRPLTLEDL